jgi:hypothetical protein
MRRGACFTPRAAAAQVLGVADLRRIEGIEANVSRIPRQP